MVMEEEDMAATHRQEQYIGYGVVGGTVGLIMVAIVGFAVWYGAGAAVSESVHLEDVAGHVETIASPVILAEHAAKGMERVVTEDGSVIGYFTDGQLNLAEGGVQRLQDMWMAVSAGQTVVIAAGRDDEGRISAEGGLQKQMMVMKNVLMGWGVPETQIMLRTVRDSMTGAGGGQLVVSLE